MTLFRPRTLAGRACLWSSLVLLTLLAALGCTAAAAWSIGCNLNEGGAGTCLVAGTNVMAPLSLLAMLLVLACFLSGPFLLVIAIGAGIVCGWRRQW